jgi:hypothetical protein
VLLLQQYVTIIEEMPPHILASVESGYDGPQWLISQVKWMDEL